MSFHDIAITVSAQNQASEVFSQVGEDARRLSFSMKELAVGISGVITAGLSLYGVYYSLENAQIAVAAATKEVHESQVTIAEYQRRLNRLVAEGKVGTEEYNLILERIGVTQELLAVKEDRLRLAQQNVTRSYVYAAATVIPAVISGAANLQKVYDMLTASKSASAASSVAHAAAEVKAAVASKLAAAANWVLNASLAMKISLLTLGIGLVAATAAYMSWLASTTRDAAAAQTEYNAALSNIPSTSTGYGRSIMRAGEMELRRRGIE